MTQDLDEPRGPDVACSIEVPVRWFELAITLQVALPRLLSCARCEGGGCDACERRGAFEQQAAGIASEVAVVLPRQPAKSCNPVCLRLPALGARSSAQPELPAGHLLLTVLPRAPESGWLPAPTVQALDLPPEWGVREWYRAARLELGVVAAELRAAWSPALREYLQDRLRSRRVWIWAALAVLVTLLCGWLYLRRAL